MCIYICIYIYVYIYGISHGFYGTIGIKLGYLWITDHLHSNNWDMILDHNADGFGQLPFQEPKLEEPTIH